MEAAKQQAERLIKIMSQEKERSGRTWGEIEVKSGIGRKVPNIWLSGRCMPNIVTFIQILSALGLELCIRRKKE